MDIYEQEQPDGRFLKHIKFRFPVYFGRLISISHGNKDEWSGFADLLANLIEKYAAVLDLDSLPEPSYSLGGKESVNNLEHSEDDVENTEIARYNHRVIDVQT